MPHLLSVVIPVFNEERTVAAMLDRVASAQTHELLLEVVIVDDGSTDNSRKLIDQWIAEHPDVHTSCISKENGGKGSAVKLAIAATTGEVVIIQDADLEYDPADYAACAEPIFRGECEVVYGSREESNRNRIYSSPGFYLGALSLTFWIDLLFNANLTDEATCYKTFRGCLIRVLAVDLASPGFEWEPEITAKLLRLGIHPYEVPISYYPRKPEDGKKIRFRDGLLSLLTAYEWRVKSVKHIQERVASLSDIDEDHVRHVRYAQGAFLFTLLIAVFRFGMFDPSRFGYVAASGLVYLTARLYQPWKTAFVWSILSTLMLDIFLPRASIGLIPAMMYESGEYFLGALNLHVWRTLGLDVLFPYLDPASIVLTGVCLQTFFFLKFAACGFVLFFVVAIFFCELTALLMPLNAWWVFPALLYLLLLHGNKFRLAGLLTTAAAIWTVLVPAAIWCGWSPLVFTVCTDWANGLLWAALPLAAFAIAPVRSILRTKGRKLLSWVLFAGYLPYLLICPPLLFPLLASFRARNSRFKKL